MPLVDASNRRHDLAGRAVSALESVVVDESLLHHMQLAITANPLDRGDFAAIHFRGECQARGHPEAVDMDGTGAALTMIATLFCSGEIQLLAQDVQKRRARVDCQMERLAVDGRSDDSPVRFGNDRVEGRSDASRVGVITKKYSDCRHSGRTLQSCPAINCELRCNAL